MIVSLLILKQVVMFLCVLLPLQILGWFILPIALLFIPKDQEYLPYFLRWFDNHEYHYSKLSHLDGLAGPDYYRKQNRIYPYAPFSFWRLWYYRYNWLAFRNPVNYFQYKVLGLPWVNNVFLVRTFGNPNTGDKTQDGHYFIQVKVNNKMYWEYYAIVRYPFTKKCIRFRFGWKIGTIEENHAGEVVQWVCTITPMIDYTGK